MDFYRSFRSILCSLSLSVYSVAAFTSPIVLLQSPRRTPAQQVTAVDFLDSANSFLIVTIDSDIASVSENEFKPIFMGGVLVMFGGLISALIVGFIVDSRNLYANLVADSYAQSADDEEFWKGLSEEEKRKAQELLQKVKEGRPKSSRSEAAASTTAEKTTASSTVPGLVENLMSKKEKKEIGMFSDYGDDA